MIISFIFFKLMSNKITDVYTKITQIFHKTLDYQLNKLPKKLTSAKKIPHKNQNHTQENIT